MSNFLFDLDDTLVRGDIIAAVSKNLYENDAIDRIYTNKDVKNFALDGLPDRVKEATKTAFCDPEYVWIKEPLPGCYYFLRTLEAENHSIGILTSRPNTLLRETSAFITARFPRLAFDLDINFCNDKSDIDVHNLPSKYEKLKELDPDFYFDDNETYCKSSLSLNIMTFLISNKFTPWNHEYANCLINKPMSSITMLRNPAFFPSTWL